jgi:S1-C subfamily serine protease
MRMPTVVSLFLLALLCPLLVAGGVRIKAERIEIRDGKPVLVERHGTAVFITEHELLTAAHVLEKGTPYVEVGGTWTRCELVRQDLENDIALLKTKAAADTVHPLAPPEPPLTAHVSRRGGPVLAQAGPVTRGRI